MYIQPVYEVRGGVCMCVGEREREREIMKDHMHLLRYSLQWTSITVHIPLARPSHIPLPTFKRAGKQSFCIYRKTRKWCRDWIPSTSQQDMGYMKFISVHWGKHKVFLIKEEDSNITTAWVVLWI